jgi:YhcH/YjgK/YiaL family protein
MIVDTLQNAGLYKNASTGLAKAFEYLLTTDFEPLAPGKYEVDGDNVFAIISEFETKDKTACEIEAHRKYIDIQYLVKGVEMFGYAPLAGQVPIVEYDEANDFAVYREEVSYIKLEAGMFIIFLPSDLHQPEVRQYEPVTVKKVVMKVKLSENFNTR